MKNRTTKFAVAAMIVVAALIVIHEFGGSIDGASVAWAELVRRVEQSHSEYYAELLLAMEEGNAEKAASHASKLSEFWQGIGWLARARLDPQVQFQLENSVNIIREKTLYDNFEQSDQEIFLAYASEFIAWIGKIEDVAWINEAIHVCKQMEEYAEEMRDGARSLELGFSYIEHCLPSFIAYCDWLEQLPWDDPGQYMTPATVLAGIERDLGIARREIGRLEIRSAHRFVKRSVQQGQKNALGLSEKIGSSETGKQWKLCRQLTRKIDELYDLMTYATIASWDIQESLDIRQDAALLRVLTKEFANKGRFADYLLERIDESVDLCEQLSVGLGSVQ